jgi:hypothetical protein
MGAFIRRHLVGAFVRRYRTALIVIGIVVLVLVVLKFWPLTSSGGDITIR